MTIKIRITCDHHEHRKEPAQTNLIEVSTEQDAADILSAFAQGMVIVIQEADLCPLHGHEDLTAERVKE